MDRHDREELVDRPAVRQRLEQREVAEVAVHEHGVEIDEDVLVVVAMLLHDRRDQVDRGVIHLLGHRAPAQGEHAAGEQLLRALLVERHVMEDLLHSPARRALLPDALVIFPHFVQDRVIVVRQLGHGRLHHGFDVDHLDQQQRVVRRQRTSRLADDVRHG